MTEGTVLGAALVLVGCALVVGRGDSDENSDGDTLDDGAVLSKKLGNIEVMDGVELGEKLSVGSWLDVGAAGCDGIVDGATLTDGCGD